MPEWVKENKELEKKAWAGDDEAFFELLMRNPEYLKTDLAMARIMEWQYRGDTKKKRGLRRIRKPLEFLIAGLRLIPSDP